MMIRNDALVTVFLQIFILVKLQYLCVLDTYCNTWHVLGNNIWYNTFNTAIIKYDRFSRRDRGFCYKTTTLNFQLTSSLNGETSKEITCFGNVIFSYLIPSILHLVAYVYTVYLFRIKENEQLQNLMERAFLLSSNSVNRGNQRRLVRILWFFIALSLVWIIIALVTVNVLMAQESIVFQWLEHRQVT